MLKKLERQAQMEASRIAKREKVQNMLAEKQKMKEQKEHVLLNFYKFYDLQITRPFISLISLVSIPVSKFL